MNFEDEDYVRYYTRETASWLALGFEGQTVLALMLHGKFDRSGVFECGDLEPAEAVSLVTRAPIKIVSAGLARLLKGGTWVLNGKRLVWPNYVRGQNCRRSDRVRQQESRESRRLEAMSENTDENPDLSQPVTRGHPGSQPVTPSLSDPSQAKPSVCEPPLEPAAKKPKVVRWRRFPKYFIPDDTHRAIAHELRLDLAEQLRLIGDHEFKDPKSDPAAVFRTWLRNAPKFNAAPASKSGPAQPGHTGKDYKLFRPEGDAARRALRNALYEAARAGKHGPEVQAQIQAAQALGPDGRMALSSIVNELERKHRAEPTGLGELLPKVGT